MKDKTTPMHLFVRYKENPNLWQEVKEVNIGSLFKPNKEIIEVRWIPEDSFFWRTRDF